MEQLNDEANQILIYFNNKYQNNIIINPFL